MDINTLRDRIGFKGDLEQLLKNVASEFNLGDFKSFSPILIGYEDTNFMLITTKGKFLVKIFAKFRSKNEVQQYVKIMELAIINGVKHPKLLKHKNGYLYKRTINKDEVSLTVMDYIEGKDFFSLRSKPNTDEIVQLAQQTALISKINFKPESYYDMWAIPNFLKELNIVKDLLDKDDLQLIKPLEKLFLQLKIKKLPHCFIHGDIISTNVIKSPNNGIFILDFAAASWYPRIQDLAILFCDLLFYTEKKSFLKNYKFTLSEYQKIVKLKEIEIRSLPAYIMIGHSMHIIATTKEMILKNNTIPENEYWLKLGKDGLRFTTELWSDKL